MDNYVKDVILIHGWEQELRVRLVQEKIIQRGEKLNVKVEMTS